VCTAQQSLVNLSPVTELSLTMSLASSNSPSDPIMFVGKSAAA
jgi:hypothetical protein